MKITSSLFLVILISTNLFGQNCKCPAGNISAEDKPSKIYKFSNGKKLGLCGTGEIINKEKRYSEFIIYQCGVDSAFLEVGAMETCTVEQSKDTLIVQEFYGIANGKNLSINWIKFYVTKIFFKGSILSKKKYFKQDLEKYKKGEIEKVMNEYRNTKKNCNSEKILLIGHRLFWAYVSGSKKAGEYLENFYKKYGEFDGAISEEYREIIATYELYKILNNASKK